MSLTGHSSLVSVCYQSQCFSSDPLRLVSWLVSATKLIILPYTSFHSFIFRLPIVMIDIWVCPFCRRKLAVTRVCFRSSTDRAWPCLRRRVALAWSVWDKNVYQEEWVITLISFTLPCHQGWTLFPSCKAKTLRLPTPKVSLICWNITVRSHLQ